MARRDNERKKKKVDVKPRREVPLQTAAFSALDALGSSQLIPSPEPATKPTPSGEPVPRSVSAKAVTTKSGVTKGVAKFKRATILPQTALKEPAAEPNSRGRVVLRRETKKRGGKPVIVVTGFKDLAYTAVAVGDLARKLRSSLACGGSFDRNEIILQGDHPAEVTRILRHMGFRVEGVTS